MNAGRYLSNKTVDELGEINSLSRRLTLKLHIQATALKFGGEMIDG
jgi:hypothetical protein